MTLAQPVSIRYRLGPCEPIIGADNDPTEWEGGLVARVLRCLLKAGRTAMAVWGVVVEPQWLFWVLSTPQCFTEPS